WDKIEFCRIFCRINAVFCDSEQEIQVKCGNYNGSASKHCNKQLLFGGSLCFSDGLKEKPFGWPLRPRPRSASFNGAIRGCERGCHGFRPKRRISSWNCSVSRYASRFCL